MAPAARPTVIPARLRETSRALLALQPTCGSSWDRPRRLAGVLGNSVQPAIKGALLGWRQLASPLLEPPTRKPFDAALDGELGTFVDLPPEAGHLP